MKAIDIFFILFYDLVEAEQPAMGSLNDAQGIKVL